MSVSVRLHILHRIHVRILHRVAVSVLHALFSGDRIQPGEFLKSVVYEVSPETNLGRDFVERVLITDALIRYVRRRRRLGAAIRHIRRLGRPLPRGGFGHDGSPYRLPYLLVVKHRGITGNSQNDFECIARGYDGVTFPGRQKFQLPVGRINQHQK